MRRDSTKQAETDQALARDSTLKTLVTSDHGTFNKEHSTSQTSLRAVSQQTSPAVWTDEQIPSNKEEGLSGRVTPSQSDQEEGSIARALANIERCMAGSNLSTPALLPIARGNAQLFMEQYQQIVPPNGLHGYANHCWKSEYRLSLRRRQFNGRIGDRTFSGPGLVYWFTDTTRAFIKDHYKEGFSSSTVCLPNLYLLGFERCGTTHLWCLLSKLLNHNVTVQATKEPFFWAPYHYKPATPTPRHLASLYVPMFLPSMDPQLPLETRQAMAAIDASPYTIQSWPKFSGNEPDLANYCLLPSALPELLPGSKFIVIMRDPVEMVYSAFWWSVIRDKPRTKLGKQVASNHSRGPEAFHSQAQERIALFLECMNDHPSVGPKDKCTLFGDNYSSCITRRTHLLSECVQRITTKRAYIEAVIHRGIYYSHVRKWVDTLTRERVFLTTLEELSANTHSVLTKALQFLGREQASRGDIESILGSCRRNHNPQYKKPALALLSKTRQMLERFFEPFNKLLSELLGDEQFLWQRSTQSSVT